MISFKRADLTVVARKVERDLGDFKPSRFSLGKDFFGQRMIQPIKIRFSRTSG